MNIKCLITVVAIFLIGVIVGFISLIFAAVPYNTIITIDNNQDPCMMCDSYTKRRQNTLQCCLGDDCKS